MTIEESKAFSGEEGFSYPSAEELRRFPNKSNKTKGEVLAILAFLAALISLVLSYQKGRRGTLATSIVGSIGIIPLPMLSAKLNHDIFQEGRALFQLHYMIGLYLTGELNGRYL